MSTIKEAIESLKKEYPNYKPEMKNSKDDTGNGINVVAKDKKDAAVLRKYYPMRYSGYRVFVIFEDADFLEKWGEH